MKMIISCNLTDNAQLHLTFRKYGLTFIYYSCSLLSWPFQHNELYCGLQKYHCIREDLTQIAWAIFKIYGGYIADRIIALCNYPSSITATLASKHSQCQITGGNKKNKTVWFLNIFLFVSMATSNKVPTVCDIPAHGCVGVEVISLSLLGQQVTHDYLRQYNKTNPWDEWQIPYSACTECNNAWSYISY